MNQELINNKYKIIKSLNESNQNTYLGEIVSTKEKIVIKKRTFKNTKDWKILELFEREIEILKQIKHPKTPKYIDSFTIDTKENDTEYYLIYEYIEGRSIKESVLEGRVFTEDETRKIIKRCLEILRYLHEFHPPIIHRDINPANIIISSDNEIYLVDFGAVKDILEYDANNPTIVGTYGYMPIEQTMGKASASSDIYAIGMTAVFMLTGENPSKLKIARGKPDFKSYCEISEGFAELLNMMIEPVMEDRLQNIDEVYNELRLLKIDKSYKSTTIEENNQKDEQKNLFNKTLNNKLIEDNIDSQQHIKEDIVPKEYPESDDYNTENRNGYLPAEINQNQELGTKSYKDLERLVDSLYMPSEFGKLRLWKDFDAITFYFKNNSLYKRSNKGLSSALLLIPMIMLFTYIGIESMFEPFFILAMLFPLVLLFSRGFRSKNTNSIQLKSTYAKIITYKDGVPEVRMIGYDDMKEIYARELTNGKKQLVLVLKNEKSIEIEADLRNDELEWVVKTCKRFIDLALNLQV